MALACTFNLGISIVDNSASGTSALQKSIAGTYGGSVNAYVQPVTIGVLPPSGLAAVTSTSGGALTAATYYWKVTALNGAGETIGSGEISAATTGSTSSAALTWAVATGATSYKIYRGTAPGSESIYFTATTTMFTDIGGAGTSGTVPGSNTTGTTWTPTLQLTPLQSFFLRNLATNTGTVSLTWTPTGGSSEVSLLVLVPGGFIDFLNPAAGGGITALTVTVSAPGTQVEACWTS